MLKFNLTQEGKTEIGKLQNNDKLAITHIRLLQSGDRPSVDLPIRSGAIVVDGTCNGPYAVVDVNDTSANNYLASAVALLSNEKSIAELYSDEKASGYEVVLSSGTPGRTEYPSIKYRTKTWASGKIPSRADIMGTGDDYDVTLSFGRKGGDPNDPSLQDVMARITLGDNFPKTITFNNGDIWETDDTVSTNGVKNGSFSYGASSENGETSIRPLYSKISVQKESNKQLKLRLSCQFDGAEKCKFNTTSINLPYATKSREGVVRFADPSIYDGTADGQRYNTVYSAKDVDDKINAVTNSLGNLDQYAKKAVANEFTANNTFTAGITVNGEIGGNAVTDAGTDGDKHIVNVGYADSKYLTKTDAGTIYLTKTDAGTTYLSKTEASSTYLTQKSATETYLSKTDAMAAAVNYAKLNTDNEFNAGTTNTFNGDVTVKGTFEVGPSQEVTTFKVTGDSISGNAIQHDKVVDSASNKLPTEGAVKKALDAVESILQGKDNDLQSQIDGINAGQNLADIVNNTTELEGYDVSHLKAKGDSLPGKPSTTLKIGDKVQVLGSADVQSSVYELIKGTKPEGETNSIQSTSNAAYYWHYIGVYGTNAYTKSDIDKKVSEINSAINTKADTSYVNDELAKKVDKSSIDADTIPEQASGDKVPSTAAVKTYVDGKVGDINADLKNYVTLNTQQEITGAKTFANGIVKVSNPNTDHKDKHYVTIGAAGDNTTSDYTSSIIHNDTTHNDYATDQFVRARPNPDDPISDNAFYTRSLSRHGTNSYTFGTKLEQHIGTHYKYTASDMYMTTGDPNKVSPLPAAQIGTPGNTTNTNDSLKENYVERIRLRRNTSTAASTEGGFLQAGHYVTDIDLFADNINNVFNNKASFRVCTTSGAGAKTDTSILEIRSTGVYYHTTDGNSISTTEYQLRTAGSLDFTTNMSELVGSDSYVPTTKAVAEFVDNKIITGSAAFVKTSAPNTNQTIDSEITVTQGITVGSDGAPATLTVSGAITGGGVATQVINTNIPDQVTTARAVANFVTNAITENKNDTSNKNKVGAMGLFLYTGGDSQAMGAEVDGTSLQAVGMQLPMDGVVSWSQGTAMEGRWKLLNNTIAGEPCLVLAIRTV